MKSIGKNIKVVRDTFNNKDIIIVESVSCDGYAHEAYGLAGERLADIKTVQIRFSKKTAKALSETLLEYTKE